MCVSLLHFTGHLEPFVNVMPITSYKFNVFVSPKTKCSDGCVWWYRVRWHLMRLVCGK